MSVERGRAAEAYARGYLERAGLRCLTQNFRCRLGELDLVMAEGHTLVFVEVRHRSGSGFGGALESIDRRKQARLLRAAEFYLQRHPTDAPCRFDVFVLAGPPGSYRVEWIKNAIETV